MDNSFVPFQILLAPPLVLASTAVSSFMGVLCNVKAPYFLLQGFSEAIHEMLTETPPVFTHVQLRSSGKFKLMNPSFTHLGRNHFFLPVQRSEKNFINLLQ